MQLAEPGELRRAAHDAQRPGDQRFPGQRFKRLAMSKQDLRDEHKETEGSPELKGHIRRRQMAVLSGSMRKAVSEATVVLMNPTHFAVALRYQPRDLAGIPDDHVLGWTEVDAVPERVPDPDEETIRRHVGEWLETRRSLICAIRSKVLPEADVIYLNPRHPDAARVPPLTTRHFDFAECLLRPPMLDRFSES